MKFKIGDICYQRGFFKDYKVKIIDFKPPEDCEVKIIDFKPPEDCEVEDFPSENKYIKCKYIDEDIDDMEYYVHENELMTEKEFAIKNIIE